MNRLRIFASLLLVLAVVAGISEAGPGHVHKHKKELPAKTAASKTSAAKQLNSVVCPVTGEGFIIKKTSPKASYKGKLYFFCCNDCKPLFTGNPAKYSAAQ